MRMLSRALAACAFACLLSTGLQAEEAGCGPAPSLDEIRVVGEAMVASGALDELLVLEDRSLARYVEALNTDYDAGIPPGLSHIVIGVRKDGSAALFGFVGRCRSGTANLGAGIHEEIYAREIDAVGAGS